MKCPICDFITNPNNDLCSRCFSDLRPVKAELGFKILNPDLSYEDLLATKVRIVRKQKAPPAEKIRIFKFKLPSIFRKKSKTAIVSDLQETIPEVPVNSSSLLVAEVEEESGLRLSKRQKEQMLALLRRRQGQQQTESASRPVRLQPDDHKPLEEGIGRLFSEVSAEFAKHKSFEPSGLISGNELIKIESDASLKALFEIVAADLLQPEQSRQFVDPLEFKKVSELESEHLKKAVQVFQKEDLDYQRKQALGAIKFDSYIEGQEAASGLRLKAWGLDCAICFIISLLLAALTEIFTGRHITSFFLGELDFAVTDLLTASISAVFYFFIARYAAMPLIRRLRGATPGEKHFGLKLVDEDHRLPGLFTGILWNLSEMVALCSLGLSEYSRLLSKEKICAAKILRC